MSNKKWRRPANPEYKPPVVEPEQDEQQREHDDPARPEVAAKVEAAVPQVAAPAAMHQPIPQFDLNVSDDEAAFIAKRIADKVSEEMTFPGEIKVTVLRETRAIEIAR